ncbi:MAG: wax ester/triacylglycerol synthase family O-acyltransferase, partial [Actinomycetota bacterium]|nr:wax ester/triacylglycerol synthase family O-acyltransferase [Actinomycetota bacterium]
MSPARLSALDAAFLSLESADAPMHVGWAALFDPPAAAPPPRFEQIRAHIESRLGRAPRYRQRLAHVPLGLGDPVWVDDGAFDIGDHVLRAGDRDFERLVDDVLSAPLRHGRPLWELWIADDLPDGRIGVVGKAHHCLVDGLAAVELMALLLDVQPAPPGSD